jgi:hypothetical protein
MTTLADWLNQHPFTPIEVDCTTTIMLKILDGKCKMNAEDKIVISKLYHAIKHLKGELLEGETHQLIANASGDIDEEMKMWIYEKRLMAETMISRPVMKQFKARIRAEGLYALGL